MVRSIVLLPLFSPRLNPIPQPVQFNPDLHYHPSNPLEPPPNFTLHHLPPNPPAPPPNFIHNQFHQPITFPTPIQPSTALPFQAHQPPQHTPNTSIVTFTNPQPTIPIPTTQYNPTHLGRLPKLNFPKFDGDHTQFWITCASNYFEMYAVKSPMWIRVTTMHFTGAAKHWLYSIEHRLASIDWPTFCALIHERFSRDQHELLLRQLFNIRQTGSVSEYVVKFTSLID